MTRNGVATCILASPGIRAPKATGGHDPEAFVEIGSLSKILTGTAAMQLVAKGTLSLDDPLERWLDVPHRAGISLQHLLVHTSGLPRLPDTTSFVDPYRPFTERAMKDLLSRLDTLVAHEPGSHEEYSNLGYAVLGAALAAADRQPYEDLLREHVLAPLGLTEGFTAHPPRDRRLTPRGIFGRRIKPWTLDGPILPAAGMWATPSATATLLTRLLVDRALGDPAPTWQRTGKLLWHNGGTRSTSTFAGAFADGDWIFVHRMSGSTKKTDQLAVDYLKTVRNGGNNA